MKKWKKTTLIVISVILSVVLALIGAFFIVTYIGKAQFHQEDTHISAEEVTVEDEDTISYNGKKYTLNENIVSFLIMLPVGV